MGTVIPEWEAAPTEDYAWADENVERFSASLYLFATVPALGLLIYGVRDFLEYVMRYQHVYYTWIRTTSSSKQTRVPFKPNCPVTCYLVFPLFKYHRSNKARPMCFILGGRGAFAQLGPQHRGIRNGQTLNIFLTWRKASTLYHCGRSRKRWGKPRGSWPASNPNQHRSRRCITR